MKFNWGRENWVNAENLKNIKTRCSKLLEYYGNVHLAQHKYYYIKNMHTYTHTHAQQTHTYTTEIQQNCTKSFMPDSQRKCAWYLLIHISFNKKVFLNLGHQMNCLLYTAFI
jgi:hypothetical protein